MLSQRFIDEAIHTPLFHVLDTNGDGTGTHNAIGDYSLVETSFFYVPPQNTKILIDRINVVYSDTGRAYQAGYGAEPLPLTTGIQVNLTLNGITYSLNNGTPIKTNEQWIQLGGEYEIISFRSVDETIKASTGHIRPLLLDGDKGDKIEFLLHDNFTFLTSQYFSIKGAYAI